MATVYTTDPSEFLNAIYYHADASQQGYPVQCYIGTTSPTGNFVLRNRFYTKDDSSAAANKQTPAAIRLQVSFDLAHTPAGSGDVHCHGYCWFYRSGESNWTYKYTGAIDLTLSQSDILIKLTGGFMSYDNDNGTQNGYYVTTQGQYFGEYGPKIAAANMSVFRGMYVVPQPVT